MRTMPSSLKTLCEDDEDEEAGDAAQQIPAHGLGPGELIILSPVHGLAIGCARPRQSVLVSFRTTVLKVLKVAAT